MNCASCGQRVVGQCVVEDNAVLHLTCEKKYHNTLHGRIHPCPKCEQSGLVDDPSGRMETKEVPLAPGEVSECGFNGCRGCGLCSRRIKMIQVPAKIRCNLCSGHGWLNKEAKPITKIVDWTLD